MMKKQTLWLLLLCLLVCSISALSGCGQKEADNDTVPYDIYFKSADGCSLVSEKALFSDEATETLIAEMIEQMQTQLLDNPDKVPAVPTNMKVKNVDVSLLPYVTVNFSKSYLEMSKADEVMCRAALVQTLTQINGVEYVEIKVDGQKLVDANDVPIGAQNIQNFVTDNNQLLARQKTEIILYFLNKKQTKLVQEEQTILDESDTPIANIVMNQLLLGPTSGSLKPLFPENVEVLNISVKNHICYVNFNDAFLQSVVCEDPYLVIYGIVNSLVELDDISSVQFLVEGSSDVKYASEISLAEPFGRDGKYVQSAD